MTAPALDGDGATPVSGVASEGAATRNANRAPHDAPVPRAARAPRREPVQEYYSIGEVCDLTGLKAHVLRYWETQFRALSPAKNRSGNRVYARREVELVLLVKHLLYTEKYTVEGARQKLGAHRRAGELRAVARASLAREAAAGVEHELREIVALLEGRRLPTAGEPAEHAGRAPVAGSTRGSAA